MSRRPLLAPLLTAAALAAASGGCDGCEPGSLEPSPPVPPVASAAGAARKAPAGVARGQETPSPLAEQLLAEFRGAYPEQARSGGPVRSFELTAAETEVAQGAPGQKLRVWAYNGRVPGPILRIRLGETLRVKFTNRLKEPTTIHWHGVRLPLDMDGVPFNPRPPVAPGETFTYEFTPKDAGTFWYHPHIRSSEQVERGLYGVLIVEDERPQPWSRDLVWVLDDWKLDQTRQIDPQFNTRHDLAHDGRWGNLITVNGRTDTLLEVKGGERIRLRLINTANGRIFRPDLSVLGEGVQVIAIDGLYVQKPFAPGVLEISPGNRVDLDLRFAAGTSRELELVDRFYARRPNPLGRLRVDDVVAAPPAFEVPTTRVPAWKDALLAPVAHEYRLNARRGGQFGLEWTLNDQAFAGHHAAGQGHDHGSSLALRTGRFYRLRFTNESARLHPMHIHGMFFRVLARNGRPAPEPYFRDTVLVHSRETIDVGVVPLDEGRWMMHCHILEHAESGMMTMIDVEVASTETKSVGTNEGAR